MHIHAQQDVTRTVELPAFHRQAGIVKVNFQQIHHRGCMFIHALPGRNMTHNPDSPAGLACTQTAHRLAKQVEQQQVRTEYRIGQLDGASFVSFNVIKMQHACHTPGIVMQTDNQRMA